MFSTLTRHRLLILLTILVSLLFFNVITDVGAQATTIYPQSPLRIRLSAADVYTRETRIGTIRHTYEDYGAPNCRVAVGTVLPNIPVTIDGDREEEWPILTTCRPDTGSDHHMAVTNFQSGYVYEFWNADWNGGYTALEAGGGVDYLIAGSGITANTNQRTTASGLSVISGQIRAEDLTTCAATISHGMTISLPRWAISTSYIDPAIGGEEAGTAGSGGIPMGARFALPRNLDVNSIPNIHNLTRTVLRALQTYGVMAADGNSAANYLNRANGAQYAATGTIKIEPGVVQAICGVSNDSLINTVGNQVGAVIAANGLWRVTLATGGTATPTFTITPTLTRTPTNTPIGATAVPTATPTPVTLICRLFHNNVFACP